MIEHIPIWMYIGFAIVAILIIVNILGLWNDKCPYCKSNRLKINRIDNHIGIRYSNKIWLGNSIVPNHKNAVYICNKCNKLFKYNNDNELIESK
jgi:phage FluMu protein Com